MVQSENTLQAKSNTRKACRCKPVLYTNVPGSTGGEEQLCIKFWSVKL